jgi:hypothetical protein
MNRQKNDDRRKLLSVLGLTSVAVVAAPAQWVTPVINAVMLPAHAQTSVMCTTDITVGGPLIGHSSGAASCQEACEAEAFDQSAQLCAVNESLDGLGGTQCGCDLDLP